MVDLFSTRQMALLSRTLYRVEMKADAEIQQYTGPQPVWWAIGGYPRLRVLCLYRKIQVSRCLREHGA